MWHKGLHCVDDIIIAFIIYMGNVDIIPDMSMLNIEEVIMQNLLHRLVTILSVSGSKWMADPAQWYHSVESLSQVFIIFNGKIINHKFIDQFKIVYNSTVSCIKQQALKCQSHGNYDIIGTSLDFFFFNAVMRNSTEFFKLLLNFNFHHVGKTYTFTSVALLNTSTNEPFWCWNQNISREPGQYP